MKLVVKIDYNHVLAFPAEQAGVLVPALATAQHFADTDYNEKTYKPKDRSPLEFQFVEDSLFGELPEAFVALQSARDESEKKYLDEWSKGRERQKTIDELQAKIKAMQEAVGSAK